MYIAILTNEYPPHVYGGATLTFGKVLVQPGDSGTDARLRIFTPSDELP